MTVIRALVVDDEPLARRKLITLLREAGDVEVVGECRNGEETIARLRAEPVDLVFLDVQMPEVSGLEVVEAVGPAQMPTVVFVTAFEQYAVRAFEFHAVDYLLKPFARARFQAMLDRVRARVAAGTQRDGDRLEKVVSQLERQRGGLRRITVQDDGRIFFVDVDQISRIESDGNYLRLHVAADSHRVRGTVQNIEARLDPTHFVRISRGALANLSHVSEVQPWFRGGLILLLRDGTRIPVSAAFAPRLREAIENPF